MLKGTIEIELLATGDIRAFVELEDSENTILSADAYGPTAEECIGALPSRILSAMEEACGD